MKKIFSKIFIVTLVLGFFFAPIQENLSSNKDVKNTITTKTAFAQTAPGYVYTYTNVLTGPNTQSTIFTTIEECRAARTATINRFGTLQSVIDSMSPDCIPTTQTDVQQGIEQLTGINTEPNEYGCGAHPKTWFTNCLVQAVYLVIFQPVAFFARLAAYVLDFFVFYSISSGSYVSDFIESGWGIVRDIANVIFIVALLYVAVKTVLGLNSSNNKKMVGMIIVMALLINFSLFATKVVIDASNILARVFYSNIDSVDQNGVIIEGTDTGQKSITVGLVKQFNPHAIFGSAVTIEQNLGAFTAILIMSLLMMGYMIFMFLSVALLFVARVIMLWILMIFSPIAFVSLTIPSMKIPGFGWDEWWEQLSENAFLAPIFVFFLYLIISFGDVIKVVTGNTLNTGNSIDGGLEISGAVPETTFQQYMAIVIPFILIFVLLSKAKDITVKMSGEMGSMVNKVGALAGGFAGGAALGATAFLGTRTIGAGSKYLGGAALSERLRNVGTIRDDQGNVIGAKKGLGAYFARAGLKSIDYGQKATFDVRQSGVGKFVSNKSGLDFQSSKLIGLGSKEGGISGYIDRKAKETEKEKELYKTSMNDNQVKEYTLDRREKFLNEKADIEVNKRKEEARKAGLTLTSGDIKLFRDQAKLSFVSQAPKVYDKAADLNKERMIVFQDRLGQSDLLSSMAHTGMSMVGATVTQSNFQDKGMQSAYLKAFKEKKKKKEREEKLKAGEVFDENDFNTKFDKEHRAGTHDTELGKFDAEIAKTVNDSRAKTVKMVVGGAAAVATGGVAGSMMTGALATGLVGGIAGTTAGATMAGQNYVDGQVVDQIKDNMQKEARNSEKLANRISDLNKTLTNGKTLKRTERDAITHAPILDPVTGNEIKKEIKLFTDDNVDKEKLKTRIVENDTEIDALKEQIKTSPNNTNLVNRLNEAKLEKEVLMGLKTAEKELFDLTGKKPENNT